MGKLIKWGGVPLSVFLLGIGVGCSHSPTAPSSISITGAWGGDHVALTAGVTSSHLEFDCAHGDIAGAFTTDATGAFALTGTYTREHGGPTRQGEPLDVHLSLYTGRVIGDTIRLTVSLTDQAAVIGTVTLTRNMPGRVVKCL